MRHASKLLSSKLKCFICALDFIAGMVDTFQKKYEALEVPYPKDSVTFHIEKQAVEHKASYEKFVADSKLRSV